MSMDIVKFSDNSISSLLPERPARSNKATFGKVLVIAGSYCMSGAAYLCAKAAYRTGAGMVRVLTPEENRVILQSALPEALLTVYDRFAPDESDVGKAVKWADVVVIGPGIGTEAGAKKVLLAALKNLSAPVILDADALNLIAMDKSIWKLVPKTSVITPHPGEMSRLLDCGINEILDDVPGVCRGFAEAHGVICLLKDHNTAVSDGKDIYINNTGNSGMATAGSGDVLAGIIAALYAGGMTPFASAVLGARIHGMAGDLAAEKLGEYSLMASDIIDELPEVMKNH